MAFGTQNGSRRTLLAGLCLVLAACGGEVAPVGESMAPNASSEAASVNGQIIYVADVEMEALMKGVISRGEKLEPSSAEFNEILDQLIDVKLMSMEAIARGLDQDPEARHRLDTARDNILGNILLEAIAAERIDEAAVRRMYETQVTLLEQQMENEVRLRHILAATRSEIDSIAADLRAGADFAVTAARRSIDEATRMDGGDLGYLTEEDATPEFARVIREVPAGAISRPFQDAQGWHIVKVEEVRRRRPPSMEALRERIERYLKAQQLEEIMKELRATAAIVKRNTPVGARPAAVSETSPPAPEPDADAAVPAMPAAAGGAASETREQSSSPSASPPP